MQGFILLARIVFLIVAGCIEIYCQQHGFEETANITGVVIIFVGIMTANFQQVWSIAIAFVITIVAIFVGIAIVISEPQNFFIALADWIFVLLFFVRFSNRPKILYQRNFGIRDRL